MKYDDFGRPIYETAEEYNKAHKGGVCPRTYDSPEGDNYQHNTMKKTQRYQSAAQRYANRTGSKKAKTMVMGLAVFFIVINVVIIFSMFNMVGGVHEDFQDFDESWIDLDDGYGEYLGDDATPLPEGFETFTYNGETITLPTTYEELLNMKFTIDTEYSKHDLVPLGFNELMDLVDEDGNIFAIVSVDNYTEDEIPLGKCTVDYFSVSNQAVYDDTAEVPDFMFGEGLTFESSYEDLEAYFGIPYYHYEDHSEEDYLYDSYEWQYFGEDESHFVTITFWNGEISDVDIQKGIGEEVY